LAKKRYDTESRGIPLDFASNDYPFFGALMNGRHQAYGLSLIHI